MVVFVCLRIHSLTNWDVAFTCTCLDEVVLISYTHTCAVLHGHSTAGTAVLESVQVASRPLLDL